MTVSVSNFSSVPGIRLDIPDNPIQIDATGSIETIAGQLHAGLAGETKPDRVTLIRTTQWTPGLFYVVTTAMAGTAGNVPIAIGDDQYNDMFAAALASMSSPSDPTRHEQSIRNAIEAAAVLHPTAATTTAQQISGRIKEVGGKRSAAEIRKQIEGLLAGQEGDGGPILKTPQQFAEAMVDQCDDEAGKPIYSQSMYSFYVYENDVWSELSDPDMAIRITRFLQGQDDVSVTRAAVNDVLVNLKAICHVPDTGYKPPYFLVQRSPLVLTQPLLMQFANGILNLGGLVGWPGSDADETGLFDFGEDFHNGGDPRFVNVNVLPYTYEPEATCPGWLAMMETVLPRENDGDRRQEVLQELFGYTLLAGSSAYEAMLIMVGEGGCGKSTVLNLWKAMLGQDNYTSVDFAHVDKDALRLTMIDKLANFTSELDYMSKINESYVKQIVSGEAITTDVKYKCAINTPIHAKLIVSCNDLPMISDRSDGIWRRLTVLPFNVQIPEADQNPHLADELLAELPGIFRWAVEGLQRLIANNRLTTCVVCDRKKTEHRHESNTVSEFVAECCEAGETHAVIAQDLYRIYSTRMTERGRKPVAENLFGREMKRLGFEKFRVSAALRNSRSRAYRGISLNSEGMDWASRARVIETALNKSSWSNYPQAIENTLPIGWSTTVDEDDDYQTGVDVNAGDDDCGEPQEDAGQSDGDPEQ